MKERAILIAGPTASGKSSLALNLADEARHKGRNPIIINADSMQVYRELSIISARPTIEDEALVTHRLYGSVSAAVAFNTGRWLKEIADILQGLDETDLPVIVGGTGLYFKALTEGFACIPAIPEPVRIHLRNEMDERGAEGMHRLLQKIDPSAAHELKPGDGQRILRALEVKQVTGVSIFQWQQKAQNNPLLDPDSCRKIIMLPDRNVLYQRINQRFDRMVEERVLDEVRALRELGLERTLPAMKAIGVPQLIGYLEDEYALDRAIEDTKRESRRYAKRQMTWLRNQMDESWQKIG